VLTFVDEDCGEDFCDDDDGVFDFFDKGDEDRLFS